MNIFQRITHGNDIPKKCQALLMLRTMNIDFLKCFRHILWKDVESLFMMVLGTAILEGSVCNYVCLLVFVLYVFICIFYIYFFGFKIMYLNKEIYVASTAIKETLPNVFIYNTFFSFISYFFQFFR